MEPTRSTHGALVDLLERVLDRGLMIRTNIIITVAGVPLVAIDLQAAIAGMETMIENGMWVDWDAAQRLYATQEWERARGEDMVLDRGEVVQRMVLCSALSDDGAIHTWRLGSLYITNRRVVLLRKDPHEVLLDIHHKDLAGLTYDMLQEGGNKEAELTLRTKRGGETRLRSSSIRMAIGMIQRAMAIPAAETWVVSRQEICPSLGSQSRPSSRFALWKKQTAFDERGRKRFRYHLGHLGIEGGKAYWRGDDVLDDDFDVDISDIDVLSVTECGPQEMGDRSITLNCGEQSHVLTGSAEDVARAVESLDRLFKRTGEATSPRRARIDGLAVASPSHARETVGRPERLIIGASTSPSRTGRC